MQEMVLQSELTWAHTHKAIPTEPSHPSNSTDLTAFHFTLVFLKIKTTEGNDEVWGIRQALQMLSYLPSCLSDPLQKQSDMISDYFTSYTAHT